MEEEKVLKEPKSESKFTAYLPSISLYVLVLAFINQFIYYRSFNIPINLFIGISELGMLVSSSLLFILPLTVLAVLYFWTTTVRDSITEPSKKELRRRDKIKFYLMFLLFSIATVILLYPGFHIAIWISTIMTSTCVLLVVVSIFIIAHEDITRNKRRAYLTIFIIMTLYLTIVYSSSSVGDVMKGKYTGTLIKTNDTTYISNDSVYFIGKTEKFIFIYNAPKMESTIIPSEEVKKIVLVNN